MSWTYTNDPENVLLDRVRLLIGDVLSADPQLTDQEVNHFIAEASDDPYGAALLAAKALRSLFSRLVDKAVGDLRVSYSQRAQQYTDLIADLEKRAARAAASPYAGGISVADKARRAADSDRVAPAFERDQFQHPGST